VGTGGTQGEWRRGEEGGKSEMGGKERWCGRGRRGGGAWGWGGGGG